MWKEEEMSLRLYFSIDSEEIVQMFSRFLLYRLTHHTLQYSIQLQIRATKKTGNLESGLAGGVLIHYAWHKHNNSEHQHTTASSNSADFISYLCIH